MVVCAGLGAFFESMSEFGRKPFYRALCSSFAFKILLAITGALKGILLARILGPSARGTYAIAATVLDLAGNFACFGQDRAIPHFANRTPDSEPRIVANGIWHASVGGLLVGVLVLALGALFPSFIALDLSFRKVVAVSVPIALGYHLFRSVVLGRQDVARFNGVELYGQWVGIVGTLCLLRVTSLEAIDLFLLMQLLPVAAALTVLVKVSPLGAVSARTPDLGLAREMLRFGARAYLMGCLVLLLCDMNIFLVDLCLDRASAGYYALAQRAAGSLAALSLPVSQLLLPYLSVPHAGEDRKWELVRNSLGLVGGLSLLACLVLRIWIEPLIRTLYGADYLPAAGPCVLLMLAQSFSGCSTVLFSYLATRGYPLRLVPLLLGLIAVECLASVLLCRFNGIVGAALSALGTHVMLFSLLFLVSRSEARELGRRSYGT